MGRLIKNHWARLIILSAAACELDLLPASFLMSIFTNIHTRPNCCRYRGLLLAQDFLGFRHQDAGSRREAVPHITDHQFGDRNLDDGMGVAAVFHRWLIDPPKSRGPSGLPASGCSLGCLDIPRHERCAVLLGRHGR